MIEPTFGFISLLFISGDPVSEVSRAISSETWINLVVW